MSDQDLPPTTNGAPITTNTANAEHPNGAGANRPRRANNNRRTSRTTTAVEEAPAAPTPAASANTLSEAESATDASKNATRPRRGGRGRGNAKNARPEAEAETRDSEATNALNAENATEVSVPPRAAAQSAPAPVVTDTPPATHTPAPVVSSAAEAPSAPTTIQNEATTTPEVPSRYRFDRRGYNPSFPTTTPPPAEAPVPPGELRRSGAVSRLFSRPTPALAAPTEAPRPQAAAPVPTATEPQNTVASAPAATATTPTFARSAPLHVVEPEEITLPRTASPRPASAPVRPAIPAPVVPEPPTEEPTDEGTYEGNGNEELGTQSGERRNRRRRRGSRNGNGASVHADLLDEAPENAEVRPERAAVVTPAPTPAATAYVAPQTAPRTQQSAFVSPLAPTQAPQSAPEPSPYGSPEPSYARGFGPATRGTANEYRAPTAPAHSRFARNEGAPISANQVASVIAEALQQQTDRLLAEQHRHGSSPTFTIAMPSTERVGVFVDVANLLYSSRSMRIPIDFGKLLQFLRGDRRLVRAHAYCPTSPDPYADQQFLQAVKGLGYRITTKDYKTFSSGAKKADLDLDLCMGIVRIVDAGAVDTIVLVSGDSDFLPVLDYCSDHGVRVEVAAFDESTAAILRQSCDLFLNLSVVEEIRA